LGWIKTVEQAQILQEKQFSIVHYKEELNDKGDKILTPYVPLIDGTPIEGDDIIFFKDEDGRTMEVYYEDGKAYKSEIWL